MNDELKGIMYFFVYLSIIDLGFFIVLGTFLPSEHVSAYGFGVFLTLLLPLISVIGSVLQIQKQLIVFIVFYYLFVVIVTVVIVLKAKIVIVNVLFLMMIVILTTTSILVKIS